ncbi:MAG: NAD-dependent epimerase/dehydratase family protein [Cyanobacteria bacterium HKST-UBA04]|nr:NAD-dependent epimerase/dehydratase family protein [Cyanobacteria bacterium HKST-UBA04]MCA9841354.1 NAD-dependent epimerase/dehydratase family protein [Cyanobacteria bacterium HKST-UBA03]
MRVFITGGSGFIGSHIADRLIARGDEVMVIDNYETGRRDNLTPQDRLTIIEGSINDVALMEKLFDDFQPEVVVHAAASYKDPDNYIGDAETNVKGTAVVVKNSQRTNVKRIIYFQTALCYGVPQEQPITLNHPINPDATSYAISKTGGELYVKMSGIDYVVFRLANAYGPRNVSGPLPTFYHRLTNDKPCFVMDTRRDFIYVTDLVDIVEQAVDGKGDGAFHISSGKDFSIKELFDSTVKALGITMKEEVEVRPRHEDDAATILLCPNRTKEVYGMIPATPLDEGIERTINYYREFGIQETYTHLRQPDKEPAHAGK